MGNEKEKPKIRILDVTNRDGVETYGLILAKLEKTIVNLLLDEMGIFQSEFGFPVLSHEKNYLNANIILAEKGVIKNMRLEGWCRGIKEDVVIAKRNVPKLDHINLSTPTSDQMIFGKFRGMEHKDVTDMMVAAVQEAKRQGIKSIGVNAEDASRTDEDFLLQFAQTARENGAERFRYCDTMGFDNPKDMFIKMFNLAKELKLPIEIHCHNDLGMAVANSIAGAMGVVRGGQDAYINTTVNGVGERAGNADMVSVILSIKKSYNLHNKDFLDPKINLKRAFETSRYVSRCFGVPIPINAPGVGKNVFSHESGIHANGILKDRHNYELFDYEELGRGAPEIIETGRVIEMGEYGGIKGFLHVYEKLGMTFEKKEAAYLCELVKYANIHTQKPLLPCELRFIAEHPKEAAHIMTVVPPAPNQIFG